MIGFSDFQFGIPYISSDNVPHLAQFNDEGEIVNSGPLELSKEKTPNYLY